MTRKDIDAIEDEYQGLLGQLYAMRDKAPNARDYHDNEAFDDATDAHFAALAPIVKRIEEIEQMDRMCLLIETN